MIICTLFKNRDRKNRQTGGMTHAAAISSLFKENKTNIMPSVSISLSEGHNTAFDLIGPQC